MRRKKPYPHNSDIADTIMYVLFNEPWIHPDELTERVREELERRGFYPGLVSDKRIWRIYEELVRKGRMYDILQVVKKREVESG
ncbi:MAG: hypothetical protein DRZ82_04545 [Thermoprotei archaeon]|nr:MAG: hypothetical protein DRZ82_04545 [Thermoprotei archaeon]